MEYTVRPVDIKYQDINTILQHQQAAIFYVCYQNLYCFFSSNHDNIYIYTLSWFELWCQNVMFVYRYTLNIYMFIYRYGFVQQEEKSKHNCIFFTEQIVLNITKYRPSLIFHKMLYTKLNFSSK